MNNSTHTQAHAIKPKMSFPNADPMNTTGAWALNQTPATQIPGQMDEPVGPSPLLPHRSPSPPPVHYIVTLPTGPREVPTVKRVSGPEEAAACLRGGGMDEAEILSEKEDEKGGVSACSFLPLLPPSPPSPPSPPRVLVRRTHDRQLPPDEHAALLSPRPEAAGSLGPLSSSSSPTSAAAGVGISPYAAAPPAAPRVVLSGSPTTASGGQADAKVGVDGARLLRTGSWEHEKFERSAQ